MEIVLNVYAAQTTQIFGCMILLCLNVKLLRSESETLDTVLYMRYMHRLNIGTDQQTQRMCIIPSLVENWLESNVLTN